MTLKGLSIFFYLHPPSLLTPIFSFQSQTPLKKKKKSLHDIYTIIPFLCSIHLLIYFYLSLLLSWNYVLSGLLTILPKYPVDILGLTLLNLSAAITTRSYSETVLSPTFWVLSFGFSGCCSTMSTVNFPSSSRGPEVTRPLLFSRPGTGKLWPTRKIWPAACFYKKSLSELIQV